MQRRSLAARLARLEARHASRCAIPLAVRRHGVLEASDGRIFPSVAAIMAMTGQTKAPLIVEPAVQVDAAK